MTDYDGRALDLVEDLRVRYPSVPNLKHRGVGLGALDKDDLLRFVAVLQDEWLEMRRRVAVAEKGRGRQ